MGINIKNERVHELAREAARRTGQTQTSVIEHALGRLLDELNDREAVPGQRSEVDWILADVDARLGARKGAAPSTDDLYDERGLPA